MLLITIGFLLVIAMVSDAAASSVRSIAVSREFFNPSTNELVEISLEVVYAGVLTIKVLDNESQIVNHLAINQSVKPGKFFFTWNGRNESDAIVQNEAYSFAIILEANEGKFEYNPATLPQKEFVTNALYYNRNTGIISYQLQKPARILMQVWRQVIDPSTKAVSDRLVKTLSDYEPRASGSIIQSWNGFDDSEKTYIPNFPDFYISIMARPLPENSVIATGKNSSRNSTSSPLGR